MKPRIPLPVPLDSRPFTTAEASRAGLGAGRLLGADLQHPFRGVHAAVDLVLTTEALCLSLSARLPDTVFYCGVTAAALWLVPLPSWAEAAPIQVGVTTGTAPVGRGLRGHRLAVEPGDLVTRRGLRITSAARTWIDLGGVVALPDLVAAGDFLIHRNSPLCTVGDLARGIERATGRRGIRNLRLALPLLDPRSESRKESHLRLLLATAGLVGLEANFWITTSDGVRYRADIAFPKHKVIVEYQSAFHDAPDRQRADMTRRARLQADGWLVIEVHRTDLLNPDALVARIRRTLAQR